MGCLDHEDRVVITLCPAGHRATCSGCEKAMADNTLEHRLDWMVNVISGYARESLELLGWQPTTAQILACNCAKGVDPVDYGNRLGYSCPVETRTTFNPNAGPTCFVTMLKEKTSCTSVPRDSSRHVMKVARCLGRAVRTNFKSSSW